MTVAAAGSVPVDAQANDMGHDGCLDARPGAAVMDEPRFYADLCGVNISVDDHDAGYAPYVATAEGWKWVRVDNVRGVHNELFFHVWACGEVCTIPPGTKYEVFSVKGEPFGRVMTNYDRSPVDCPVGTIFRRDSDPLGLNRQTASPPPVEPSPGFGSEAAISLVLLAAAWGFGFAMAARARVRSAQKIFSSFDADVLNKRRTLVEELERAKLAEHQTGRAVTDAQAALDTFDQAHPGFDKFVKPHSNPMR